MKLKRDLVRFEALDRMEKSYVVVPVDTIYAIQSYPQSGFTRLYSEKSNYDVIETEEAVLGILKWHEE